MKHWIDISQKERFHKIWRPKGSLARKPIEIYYVVRIQTRDIHPMNADAVQDWDMIIETEIRPSYFRQNCGKTFLTGIKE